MVLPGDRQLRVDLASARFVDEPAPPLPDNARFLGEHVYSTLDREPAGIEILGFASAGGTVWQRPYTDVFGAGYTSDGGWSWMDDDESVLVGEGHPYRPGAVQQYALTESVMVGLDAATGETLWKASGADQHCQAASLPHSQISSVVPVCLYGSGTVTMDRSDLDDASLTITGVDATLAGLDRSTGVPVWRIPLGGDPSNVGSWISKFRSNLAVRPLVVDGTVTLVDVLTGHTAELPDDAVLACETERDFFSTSEADGITRYPYSGGFGVFACDADRVDLETNALSPGALEMGGIDAGDGWFVVDGLDSLSAYRLEE